MKKKTVDSQQVKPEPKERQPKAKRTPSKNTSTSPALINPFFPIIGIGASAGGLEALELFLANIPQDSGMAFVIIQHLDPTYKGILVELLQRATRMPVTQTTDNLIVAPDTVYVIPPNKDMSIFHGTLHLQSPAAPRGLRLPIDFFFRTLAEDQQEGSVGVILSGMGSDGTLGLRAIKEKAGVTFVQTPASAKFDGMPRSAIDSGFADLIAPPEELPGQIISFLKHISTVVRPELDLENKNQSALEKIFILLRTRTGNDFSLYKKNTIYRRIERRMGIHQIDQIEKYVLFLQSNPQEINLLFKELLIGVTNFFRDPTSWEQLKKIIIPELLSTLPMGGNLRTWIPGCSTGEEAYSLAIVFKEALEQVKPHRNITLQIFASDLDKDAIDKARNGFYPGNIVADVSPERLNRFFVKEESGFKVANQIREMVIFAPHNLILDPPFTKLNLLICRNLLIYLNAELQKKLLPLFHFCLNPGGFLFLGNSESIGEFRELFYPLDKKIRLFRKLNSVASTALLELPQKFFSTKSLFRDMLEPQSKEQKPIPNLSLLTDQYLLKQYAPAAVLVDEIGNILYINGRTGKYLEPPAGKANWNIFVMAREGLRIELINSFQKALKDKKEITSRNLVVHTDNGTQLSNMTIQPLTEPDTLRGMVLIILSDVELPPTKIRPKIMKKDSRVDTLSTKNEFEIKRVQELLQSTREEMQTSQEELNSTNEELQSTNEELQSTNEELTTSKEEMQSLNEELQTVNYELRGRVDELSQSNNDLNNLMNSTDIATIFLDEGLNLRRFTDMASKIFHLLPSDAGRPITDISTVLLYPELSEDVQEVLRLLVFIEKPVATRTGGWYLVKIMPYRTLDNRIDGVVITFLDISIAKKLEEELRAKEAHLQKLLDGKEKKVSATDD